MFDPANTTLSEGVIAMRLLLAVGLGAVIGFEREQLARPAGLRTHMLTALAAALFTIITMEIHAGVLREASGHSTDPIRVIEAVTAGVAFLAAGAIFRSQGDVKGLTTGAGMWLAGAIGVACGAGYGILAIMARCWRRSSSSPCAGSKSTSRARTTSTRATQREPVAR
jgi:putative Mg2+ transporter-C (MgtC) family protein